MTTYSDDTWICPECRGEAYGWQPAEDDGSAWGPCWNCKGTGEVLRDEED